MPRVLLVEDYADAREMYALFLVGEGFEVFEAADGFQALDHSATQRPDVVVLDLGLPRMDGLEVIRRLRTAPATARVPIIILSALATRATAAQALAAGANMVLSKPCAPDDLLAVINGALAATPPGTPLIQSGD